MKESYNLMTEEEKLGEVPTDPERQQVVEEAWKARQTVQLKTFEKKQRKYEAIRTAVAADPDSWTCANCYIEPKAGSKKKDCLNKSGTKQCYKCNADRPAPESYDNWRWLCFECSTIDPLYTIPASLNRCPDCGKHYLDQVHTPRRAQRASAYKLDESSMPLPLADEVFLILILACVSLPSYLYSDFHV